LPQQRPATSIVMLGVDATTLHLIGKLGPAVLVPIHASARALAAVEAAFVWDLRLGLLEAQWKRLPNLRWVHTASAGVDHVLFLLSWRRASL
jgi:phosphoglycerate dehydrogenase-like enzyme